MPFLVFLFGLQKFVRNVEHVLVKRALFIAFFEKKRTGEFQTVTTVEEKYSAKEWNEFTRKLISDQLPKKPVKKGLIL